MNAAVRAIRGAMAIAIVAALTHQFVHGRGFPSFRAINFFSYFTVLSNIFAAVVLGVLCLRPSLEANRVASVARGAMTVYMTVTGLVYAVLLAPNDVDVNTNLKWVDVVVHQVGPVVVLGDWLVNRPPRRLTWSETSMWFGFPAVWLVYTLARGPGANWYPYPFLDPNEGTTVEIAVACIGIFVVIVALSAALRWWADRRVTEAPSAQPTGEV